jgi:hypothetical protein
LSCACAAGDHRPATTTAAITTCLTIPIAFSPHVKVRFEEAGLQSVRR